MARQYKVGYGRPPARTRFRKGQSGNPRGRPKGVRNLKTELFEELQKKISLRIGNRVETVSRRQALVKSIVADALRGDGKARVLVLGLIGQYEAADEARTSDMPSPTADQEVLERFIAREIRRRQNKSEPTK